jgi:hypothetical protein
MTGSIEFGDSRLGNSTAPFRVSNLEPRISLTLVALIALSACAPKAPPLVGVPAPAVLPAAQLPPVHRKIVFHYDFSDPDFRLRGEGVARVSPPDSVRLDFFVNNQGAGRAFLIGDSVRVPQGAAPMRGLLPPPPLLWAALGRLDVPAARDTIARVDGDTLRVDIGRDEGWRATFAGGSLRRLDRLDGGRIPQWVARAGEGPLDGPVHYEEPRAHRTLDLTILRVDTLPGFDATIWR